MLNSSQASHPMSAPVSARARRTENRFVRLERLALASLGGLLAFLVLQWGLSAVSGPRPAQAAPPPAPLADSITGPITVQHTVSTTHQMVVYGNGRITDWYLNDNGRNQIDQDRKNKNATTIAVLFDQHPRDMVDVGFDNDFYATTLVTLNDPSAIPGYSEDTQVVYASKVLSYQITQRTLTTDRVSDDWLAMELTIRNTGALPLTGGKLLFMIDIDAAHYDVDDEGDYDPSLHLVYQTDEYHDVGYAMGVALLKGDWGGYGIDGKSYLVTDLAKIYEMVEPRNTVRDGNNDVSWLVVNIPTLFNGDETEVSFGLCAETGISQTGAAINLARCIEHIPDHHINYTPALKVEVNDPVTAKKSERVTFDFTVTNDDRNSDGSPVSQLLIYDTIVGTVTSSPIISGDADSFLERGETWVYAASYIAQASQEGLVTVQGRDLNNDTILATVTHRLRVGFEATYLPLVLKDYPNGPPCCKDAFDDPSSGWITGTYEEAEYAYIPIAPPREYQILAKKPESHPTARSVSRCGYFDQYTVTVEARWEGFSSGDEYGVLFGIQGKDNQRVTAASSLYRFVVNTRGHREYSVRWYDGKGWQPVVDWKVNDNAINPDSMPNKLKVKCYGSSARIYANDHQLEDVALPHSCSGEVGVTSTIENPKTPTDARFDNFEVCGQAGQGVSSSDRASNIPADLESQPID